MKNLTSIGILCCICSFLCIPTASFSQASPIKKVNTWLLTQSGVMADGNLAVFAEQYSNDVDQWDARKMTNPGENFGLFRAGYKLAVEARQPVFSDTLFYNMSNLMQAGYQLAILHKNMEDQMVSCALRDSYTDTETLIDLTDTSRYHFMVDANPLSKAVDRFQLIYRPISASILPVKIIQFDASLQNGMAKIFWSVNNENEMLGYQLEHSQNGKDFEILTEAPAENRSTGMANYNHEYALQASGKYYYRIKTLGLDGKSEYSKIIALHYKHAGTPIRVYPNPIQHNSIGISIHQQPLTKTYPWQIISPTGKIMESGNLTVPAHTQRVSIPLRKSLPNGTYFLTLHDEGKQSATIVIRD